MKSYTIDDVCTSNNRHKLFLLETTSVLLPIVINNLKNKGVPVVNIGMELSDFVNELDNFAYLSIDVYDFIKNLLETHKGRIGGQGNDIISIDNFGIFLEPRLELNAVQLLKDFSKLTAIIIIWQHETGLSNRLEWPSQKQTYFFDFSETQLAKIQYEI